MKRTVRFVAWMLVAVMLFLLSGCFSYKPSKQPQILKSYPKESAPSQVVKTEKRWGMLHSVYSGEDYRISVGESLDSASDVYTVSGVSIWYFEADDQAIVWCEKTKETCTYKAYIFETQTVETVFQVAAGEDFQPQNIGVFQGNIYYCTIDYAQQTARIAAYNIASKTTADLQTVAFREEYQPYSITLESGFLNFICAGQIKTVNLQTNEVVFDSVLPGDVTRVFGVSYDSKNDTCAIYYADADSEDIGIIKEGDESICSIFTFNKNHYAYHDKLECYDGHIYWITQANVSGNVSDHYKLIDYDYLNHKPVETERTFDFCRDGDSVYMLRFNKDGNYTHIDLCQN